LGKNRCTQQDTKHQRTPKLLHFAQNLRQI
jgi:hypothetical protein